MDDCNLVLAVGLSFLFYVVGFVSSSLLLLFVPKLYRKLAGVVKKCRRSCTAQSTHVPTQPVVRSSNYTEIDDSKTKTFTNASYPIKAVKNQAPPKEQGRKLAYYNLAPGETNANNYEDLETKKPASFHEPEENKHVYRIVEPGSSKNLEVKLVSGPEEAISADPSHVYFILEPGTNKVKPVHMGTDPSESMKPDHVYFVLEPNSAANSGPEAEPYAVNDLHADHAYFILEKQPASK
ncbi:uncharacterized protein LOC127830966 [Dreissena polymorpha]|uniref:Uncharacterized protein n=1 Tax=Dreissena polymorpha TaxID=45954 RepID=A0A9D4GKY0_DREPO|nr:uncharacterized protein LOC127830966 [Dreissena polymorpha]XP_052211877.1 uncharacterized protein LOC127830966 [Dreissena polymorpha]KAH3818772.1 hypothetical protein DPMN_120498 [Dreissena polymorpha]